MIRGFSLSFFLPPSLPFLPPPPPLTKAPSRAAWGEEGQLLCVQRWWFWGAAQSCKRGTLASPRPLGWSCSWGRMRQLALLLSPSSALCYGFRPCPPSYPAFPPRFPKAQGRIKHPDLNFNAILAPKASFCVCSSS